VQRRLLVSMLAVAVTAVLLLGVPLSFLVVRQRTNEANQQVHRDATTLASELQERWDAGLPADALEMGRSLSDRYVVIEQRDGPRTAVGTSPGPHDSITGRDSTKNFTVTVVADDSLIATAVTDGLVVIGSLVLLALAVAVGLAILQARRLARPLQELANAADRLGSGDARPLGRRYGVPELDRVAERLDGSAQRINDLLTAERDFAVDASHQLRTPLTALSMRLEEMVAAANYPDVVREEGAAALAQTERLAEVVGHLLGRARRSVPGAPTQASVDDIVAQQVVEWEPAFRRVSRKLEVTGEKGLHAFVRPGNAAQVIDAAGQRACARRRLGHDQDVGDAPVGGHRGQGPGQGGSAGAGAADLRAQRQRDPGRNRARAVAGPDGGSGGRRPGRAGAPAPGGVRALPPAHCPRGGG
jgi:K+-sensing histidine kinase KdpD